MKYLLFLMVAVAGSVLTKFFTPPMDVIAGLFMGLLVGWSTGKVIFDDK